MKPVFTMAQGVLSDCKQSKRKSEMSQPSSQSVAYNHVPTLSWRYFLSKKINTQK